MSDEFNKSGCAPSDCASCTANCESRVDEAHHTITLTMDDDTEVECAILTIFPVENKEYIALLPLDENGQNETGEVYLYSFSRTADGDPTLPQMPLTQSLKKHVQTRKPTHFSAKQGIYQR